MVRLNYITLPFIAAIRYDIKYFNYSFSIVSFQIDIRIQK